jgi:hypothetical protein
MMEAAVEAADGRLPEEERWSASARAVVAASPQRSKRVDERLAMTGDLPIPLGLVGCTSSVNEVG